MPVDNPKQAEGDKKVPFYCLPWNVVTRLAVAMAEGIKYGYFNYRAVGSIKDSVYFSATLRHLIQHREGQTIDPDSPTGRTNLDAALASLAVWIDSIDSGKWEDDRPPRLPGYDIMMADMNARTVLLNEKVEKKVPMYTEKKLPKDTDPDEYTLLYVYGEEVGKIKKSKTGLVQEALGLRWKR
jgi:hypothetical protein